MKKYKQLLIALPFTLFASQAFSEPLSYSFVSAEYQIFSQEIDGVTDDLEGDGLVFEGSVSIAPNFAIQAGFATGEADVSGNGNTVDEDFDVVMVGALFHTPLTDTADFVIGARLLRAKVGVELNGESLGSETSNGNSIYAGVRAMATQNVELSGYIDRTKYEDSDADTDIEFGAGFYVTPTVSLDAGYSFDSDGNTLSFGVSKYF